MGASAQIRGGGMFWLIYFVCMKEGSIGNDLFGVGGSIREYKIFFGILCHFC